MPPDTATEHGIEDWANAVRSLAQAENRGALAELRRMEPEMTLPAAFWNIVAASERRASPARLRRIAGVIKVMAFRPKDLDGGRRKLGAALAAADVTESRVRKLMTARGPALDGQVTRIARRLANTAPLPYREFAELLLAENHGSPKVEDIRLEIARGYWVKRGAAPPETTESED